MILHTQYDMIVPEASWQRQLLLVLNDEFHNMWLYISPCYHHETSHFRALKYFIVCQQETGLHNSYNYGSAFTEGVGI